jgi:cation diffusion facilitator CzcD-associated flavoprotein CzcO
LAVIGAGAGGLYSAMRLVETGKYAAKDICIFEATDRVGGRIYSLRGFGPDHDITVDAGAYRTWPEFTVCNKYTNAVTMYVLMVCALYTHSHTVFHFVAANNPCSRH